RSRAPRPPRPPDPSGGRGDPAHPPRPEALVVVTGERRWPVQVALAHDQITVGSARRAIPARKADERRRALEEGLTDWQADRLAVRHGLHPAQIWTGWGDAALPPLDRLFREDG